MGNEKREHAKLVYLAGIRDVRKKLRILQEGADEHFGHSPEEINWAHVGDLVWLNQELDEIINRMI